MLMDDHNMPMQTVPTYHSLAVLYQRSKDLKIMRPVGSFK